MEVPVGFIAKLWSFLKFLPFFSLLLVLGTLKGIIIGPFVVGIIGVGNSAVVIGLWPAHFIWTYYCVVKTKKLGIGLKILILILLPVPLVLLPVFGIVGSFLGGVGYGFFGPLIATFEAVGESITGKFYHCLVDGCWSTLEGSCTVVRDFVDFCFHSYFSFMDEMIEKIPADEKPVDIKLTWLPCCLLISLLALLVDVPAITAIALWKSPYMLYRGWRRLFEDLLGREGPFLEAVCVPFAGLAIILWPIAVIGAVISAFIASYFLALYAGIIVHQEDSVQMGLGFIVAIVSLFDEYANDMLYLKEGSRLPRPRYRKNVSISNGSRRKKANDDEQNDEMDESEGSYNLKLVSECSRTLKGAIQHYKPIQVLDWLFKTCEANGRILLQDGLIDVKDIEECVAKGNFDEVELQRSNWPGERVWQWFVGPLIIMKEQIRSLNLDENEEASLRRVVMQCKNDRPEDWDEIGFPSNDQVRKAQLQAIIRRLQGIVGSMSRMPTFRRRFQNLVKTLYLEAVKTGALASYVVERSASISTSTSTSSGIGHSPEKDLKTGGPEQDELNCRNIV
ncbi:hypothetical protein Ancab_008217 [Ancistrocladus abbreviatus]